MKASENVDKSVTVRFSKEEALVFFEWLANNNSKTNIEFQHESELRLLLNLESSMEGQISDLFIPNYVNVLEKYRNSLL